MPTYIMLANWTDQGAQKVKDSPRRVDVAKKALFDMGGEFKALYMTMGEYDLIAVYEAPDDAVATARRFVAEGAAIVDIGGESTRPGAEEVTADEELRRVEPVLETIAGELPVSIDTSRAAVAREALELGAEMVNDVTALRRDPELVGVVADAGAYLCLMHMLGTPRTMQADPRYDDVAADVTAFLEERLAFAVHAGHREIHLEVPFPRSSQARLDRWPQPCIEELNVCAE